MTDHGARAPDARAGNDDEAAQAGAGIEAGADTPAEAGADALAALVKENADFRDRWLRAMAEMENLRRRAEREVADARTYGIAGFARDMVGIADNMRRALAAVPAELRENAEAGTKPLIEGVELTDRELAKTLEKHGIRRLEPQGQKFDPNFHQAMFEVPDPSVPAGTVVQVVQDGYTIGERVLRPAMVGIAKGGPKAQAGPANDNPGQGAASVPAAGK